MGIDQLNLHSVQLGYLKILQMGNTDPKNTKQENKYEVKPQYEELSKQLIMQHAIINAMKCMRAIKDRIAKPVYQLEIISISLHTRTVYQPGKSSVRDLRSPSAHHSLVISPGTANLRPSLTGHDNSAYTVRRGRYTMFTQIWLYDNSTLKKRNTLSGAVYANVRYDEDMQRRIFLTVENKEYK
ncbi:hypothetical protein F511_19436 [Dorcoceras hygrometricum]|uniref:Uncharacterized protein n=1 Tax=Dorcoceras hygrometricum TaxID=472368 RepID=A0A2Z7ALY6_9LAMI|nr:hypothetical protein F511_19436 [Dorcoceras hygrometricum]